MTTLARISSAPLVALAVVLVLSGCGASGDPLGQTTWDVEDVRALPNEGGPFDKTLQEGYVDLAAKEKAEGDWADAADFVRLARSAANGERPAAVRVEDRRFSPDEAKELAQQRAALIDVLELGGAILAPVESARAQVFFECWAQELEERIPSQVDEVAACRNGFLKALAEARATLQADVVTLLHDLDGGVGEVVVSPKGGTASGQTLNRANEAAASGGVDQEPMRSLALTDRDIQDIWGETLSAQPIPPKRFFLYFEQGGVVLTKESEALIPAMVEDAARRPVWEIEVLGHTDRVGGSRGNARLSARRAELVKALLVENGLASENISTRGFGESMLLVPTADNVDEARNRRVEVIVR
ncbi:OmpA family protein [Rhodospirillum sp. A1_3_36]|uniref:OmpA family protein n=1 Tax=Rhodospirillum sp. A1_3_36 TaxID=3391666 RepID=UPI0039A47344